MYRDHLYLTLSYQGTHLSCVIYNASPQSVPPISVGDHCDIVGQCRFLRQKGQLIFSGHRLIPAKKPHPLTDRQKIMTHYASAGAFDARTVNQVPTVIQTVGIITAPNSAAFFDVDSLLSKTPHTFKSWLFPATVQGKDGPGSLLEALKLADQQSLDVICLTRGGGADADFDPFYSKELAEGILALNTPIICGIGHQINITLACQLANAHFETPSAMIQWLCQVSMSRIYELESTGLSAYHRLMREGQQYLDTLNHYKLRSQSAIKHAIEQMENIQARLTEKAIQLNPIHRLNNGFVFAKTDHAPLISIEQIKINDKIQLRLFNGKCRATVTHVN